MNKTTRLGILLVITISLLISDKTNCDDGSSSGKQDDEEKPVFRSTQQDRYDPFIEMNKKGSDYHEKNNQEEDEEEISGEEIDQEDEQIDNINTKNKNINETKPAKRKIRKNSPTIVHNQYPYINSMDQMRPSYTTPYDYNPYTPSPSSSL